MKKPKKQKIKMNESLPRKHFGRLLVYSAVLAVAVIAAAALYSMWSSVDENKDHRWDTPVKKAEFLPGSSLSLKDSILDGFHEVSNKIKGRPDVQKGPGAAHAAQGQHDEEIRNYDNAIEAEPNNADLYLQRGSAYLRKGDVDAGVQNLEAAARLNPEYEPTLLQAKRMQSRMREMGAKSINQRDISTVINGLRPEDVERYAESMGYRLDDNARAALKAHLRNMQQRQ